jgi:uncharacterized RDD family membrane protein YckC
MENRTFAEPEEKQAEEPNPIIGGFWRRLFAFIIDTILLGVTGICIGALFFDRLAELGGWGRLLGFTVALLYFGLLNSSIGNGQTVGKRLLKIKVVDGEKQTISIAKSFLRFTILGIPYFLNGAMIPPEILSNSIMSLVLGLAVFFGTGAIIYLFIFNRVTRQSLHDLIMGTYVINRNSHADIPEKAVWRGHFVAVGTLFVAVVVLIVFVVPRFASKKPFADLTTIQRQIHKSGLVHMATVTVGKSSGTRKGEKGEKTWEMTFLSTTAMLKHRPLDYEAVASEIATVVLDAYPAVVDKDALVVQTSYGYDIGIARAWIGHRVQHTPQEWEELLMDADSGEKI